METYFYAQLDANSICTGVSQLSGEVSTANMIRLPDYDTTLCGKRYDQQSGTWSEVEKPPYEPEPTLEEIYQAPTLLNQAEIIANQHQQDKVMAAILLEQVGGEANV